MKLPQENKIMIGDFALNIYYDWITALCDYLRTATCLF